LLKKPFIKRNRVKKEIGFMTITHESIGQELMLIDGNWVESSDNRWIQVDDPSVRGAIAGEVPRGTEEDVDRAINAAAKAFIEWKKIAPRERGKIISKIGEQLSNQISELAQIVALETGNALRTNSTGEVTQVADLFTFYGGIAGEIKGETVPLGENLLSYTRREPLGVVGGIVPWNAPALLAALKITLSLTAGNTLVLKASSEAPLAVARLVRICNEHLPPGVLNLVSGKGSECGTYLAGHPGLNKLTFTGSSEVGKKIFHAAAEKIIPVSLELGGKSPQIVFPDADDDHTAAQVVSGMRYVRQGQSCTAGSRLFLHKSIYDSFLDKFLGKLRQIRVGDPLDEETDAGAIINEMQFNKVCEYISDGMQQSGAMVVNGGLPPQSGPLSEGYYLEPTVFLGVTNDWRIAREEVFGPVLVVIPWEDEQEVIRMANDSHYGLAAFVYTRDISKGLKMAHAIESGFVWVNQGGGIICGHSYGGVKGSGVGREYSLEGMLESFTQRKAVTINLDY
jgi:betaine-aldehyde dehydrogenase